jgi:multiple sugar transport system substrate-binding protein
MEARLALKGIAPPRASVFQSPDFLKWASAYPGRQQWLAALKQLTVIATGYNSPPSNRAPEMYTVIGEAVSRVMLHEVDAKTAACEAEPKIAELLRK